MNWRKKMDEYAYQFFVSLRPYFLTVLLIGFICLFWGLLIDFFKKKEQEKKRNFKKSKII